MPGLVNYTIKNLRKNKKRTLITLIGIMLSSSLLLGVGLLVSTYRDNLIKETIKENGSHHIEYREINNDQLKFLKKREEIKEFYIKLREKTGNFIKNKKTVNINVISTNQNYKELINLIQGKEPTNKKEVLVSLNFTRHFNLKVNDFITIINDNNEEIKYKITGLYKNENDNEYNIIEEDFTFYTFFKRDDKKKSDVFITLKNPKNSFLKLKALTQELGLPFPNLDQFNSNEQVTVNTSLLALYGQISDAGVYAVLFLLTLLTLTILGIICILIIYNSFAISVMERKKQLGILKSLGANPSQILSTVFLEASLISLIAIPLGLLISFINTYLTLTILNKLLQDIITTPLKVSCYPSLLLLSFLFIILVIFLSAFFPAMRAKEVSPIEAIKQNKDLKVKKIKNNKLISKLFKIEGVMAYKNIKRQKKRYRITVVSLIISTVLFILTGTYLKTAFKRVDDVFLYEQNYDAFINIPEGKEQKEIISKIKKLPDIKKYFEYKSQFIYIELLSDKFLNEKIPHEGKISYLQQGPIMRIVTLEKDTFQKYKKEIGLKKDQPILINYGKFLKLDKVKLKIETLYEGKLYKEDKNLAIKFCHYNNEIEFEEKGKCYYQLNNFYFTTHLFPNPEFSHVIIVKEKVYNYLHDHKIINPFLTKFDYHINLNLTLKKANRFDQELKIIFNQYPHLKFQYQNYKLETHQQRMIKLAIVFALYSFNFFIILIGVTSIINTINTSLNLRKRELAILRSIGQPPKSFKKMITLESLFIGIKALIYGLFITMGLIYLIVKISSLSYGNKKIIIPLPITAIIISFTINFLTFYLTMRYTTSKLKTTNIIETIKQDII